jgi:hypothetical protein
MYHALKNENPNIAPQDVRRRIEKDCIGRIWSKRTILDALPDEAKNPEKQKSGRLGQKKRYSAAVSAAPIKGEILINTEGHSISTVTPQAPAPFIDDDIPKSTQGFNSNLAIKERLRRGVPEECERCKELLIENMQLKEALAKVSTVKKASDITKPLDIDRLHREQANNSDILPFEFWLPSEDVRRHIQTTFNVYKTKEKLWFNGTLDRHTGEVLSADIGSKKKERFQGSFDKTGILESAQSECIRENANNE